MLLATEAHAVPFKAASYARSVARDPVPASSPRPGRDGVVFGQDIVQAEVMVHHIVGWQPGPARPGSRKARSHAASRGATLPVVSHKPSQPLNKITLIHQEMSHPPPAGG